MSPLSAWENFYVIVGSSAGALTGLTFVVITLLAGARERSTSWAVAAFTTPTVVHFGTVLFVAAVLSAPWPALPPVAILIGLGGIGGIGYVAIVVRRIRRRDGYEPLLIDWLSYAVGPLLAYLGLVGAALLLPGSPRAALFGAGGVMVLLLFIGIRNAWDIVTYIAIERFTPEIESSGQATSSEESERTK